MGHRLSSEVWKSCFLSTQMQAQNDCHPSWLSAARYRTSAVLHRPSPYVNARYCTVPCDVWTLPKCNKEPTRSPSTVELKSTVPARCLASPLRPACIQIHSELFRSCLILFSFSREHTSLHLVRPTENKSLKLLSELKRCRIFSACRLH